MPVAPLPDAAEPSGFRGIEALGDVLVSLDDAERVLIRNALIAKDGNREQAAAVLGISERTLYRKIKQYGDAVTG